MGANGIIDSQAEFTVSTGNGTKSSVKQLTEPITVNFKVHCHFIRPFEKVFVVGNLEKLGNWMAPEALELTRDPNNESSWSISLVLSPAEIPEMLQFRYFIGYFLQSSNDPTTKVRIINRWESQRVPRVILPSVECNKGVCRLNHTDEFGVYGGRKIVSDGWLNNKNQVELLLRLHGDCLKFYKSRHSQRKYFIKVTPFDLRHKEVGSVDDEADDADASNALPPLPSFSHTDLAVLTSSDPAFRDQPNSGRHFQHGEDYFVYRTQTVAVDYLAFRIEFFVEHRSTSTSRPRTSLSTKIEEETSISSDEITSDQATTSESHTVIPEPSPSIKVDRVGIAYLMPSSMPDSWGKMQVPVLAKNQMPIGQVTIDYLFIRSIEQPLAVPLTMEHCYSRHWKKRKTVEVGHRGFGNSYTKLSGVRENTIHSLSHASEKGADFVEFDVQLTSDKIPVIFHDFHVLVSVAKRPGSHLDLNSSTEACSYGGTGPQKPSHNGVIHGQQNDYHEMAVKDLKLQQLQLLHVDHYQAPHNKDMLKVTGSPDESIDHQPFPTLVNALKRVPVDTGFNVEIKYPMMMDDGEHECANFFERNDFVDRILKNVIEHAGKRRIVFSSFEPDICAMVARKQSLFPVLFLCVGATKRYVPFSDKRSATSLIAVNFAACEKLLGLNFHSEELLKDRKPVELAKKFGLVSFVWGDDLDNQANIDYFRKDLKLEGVVYDKIGEQEVRKNVFTVEREQKNALFRVASPTPSRHPSIDKSPSTSSFRKLSNERLSTGAEALLLANCSLSNMNDKFVSSDSGESSDS